MNDKSSDGKLQKLITITRQYTEQVVQFNKQIKRLEELINLKSLDLLLAASKK